MGNHLTKQNTKHIVRMWTIEHRSSVRIAEFCERNVNGIIVSDYQHISAKVNLDTYAFCLVMFVPGDINHPNYFFYKY